MKCGICDKPLTEATAFRRPAEVTECCPFCGKHRVPKQVILCAYHAAENMEFEKAADLRDEVELLRRELGLKR